MSITAALEGTGAPEAPLWFTAPGQLHKIDLAEPPQQRMRRTYDNAAAVLREAGEAELLRLVMLQEIMIARLLSEGAVYAAHCLARSAVHPTRLCTAEFAITIKPVDLPPDTPLSTVANGRGAARRPELTEEQAVGSIIGASFFALIAIGIIAGWSRMRLTRTVDDAVFHLRDVLGERPSDTTVTRVAPRNVYPLSEPMIKELAAMYGHNYRGRGTTGNNVAAMLFTQRPHTVEDPHDV